MRPDRFAALVTDLAKNTPTCTRVQTLAEVGDTKHPFGLAITAPAGETRWQFMGQLPDGAKHEGFADEPVTGQPAPSGPAPQASDEPEAWFAALIAHAECPEIADIERWSTRPDARRDQIGVTAKFHDGSKVFARKL